MAIFVSHGEKMHAQINFDCQPKAFGCMPIWVMDGVDTNNYAYCEIVNNVGIFTDNVVMNIIYNE